MAKAINSPSREVQELAITHVNKDVVLSRFMRYLEREIPKFSLEYILAIHHHENFNGSGYPDNIDFKNGYKIAPGFANTEAAFALSQIVHLIDVLEALSKSRLSPRPYHKDGGFSFDRIGELLSDHIGDLFDPVLVDVVLQIYFSRRHVELESNTQFLAQKYECL